VTITRVVWVSRFVKIKQVHVVQNGKKRRLTDPLGSTGPKKGSPASRNKIL
jgi:hypothetical protein